MNHICTYGYFLLLNNSVRMKFLRVALWDYKVKKLSKELHVKIPVTQNTQV